MSFHTVSEDVGPVETMIKLGGSKLILPLISLGNIPQLSIDLLIENLNCVKVARLDSSLLYPFVCPEEHSKDEADASGISTLLEVYYDELLNITILQQRSPILSGFKQEFFTSVILPFIWSMEFKSVIILDSVCPESPLSLNTILHYTNGEIAGQSLVKNFGELSTESQTKKTPQVSYLPIEKNPSKFLTSLANLISSEPQQNIQQSKSQVNLYKELKEKYPNSLPLSREGSTVSVNTKSQYSCEVSILTMQSYEGHSNTTDLELLTRELFRLVDTELTTSPDLPIVHPASWLGLYGSRLLPLGLDGLYS